MEQREKKVFLTFLFVTLAIGVIIFGFFTLTPGRHVDVFLILITFHLLVTLLSYFFAIRNDLKEVRDYSFTKTKWAFVCLFGCFILLVLLLLAPAGGIGLDPATSVFVGGLCTLSLTVVSISVAVVIIFWRKSNRIKVFRQDSDYLIFTPLILLACSYLMFLWAAGIAL